MKPYLLIAVCFLAGCGAHSVRLPEWQAIDGSRADGTVTLSYEQSCVATPARANAKVSCLIWRFEKRYQCTNHASDKMQHAPMQQQPIQNNITIELSPTNLPQVKTQ